MGHSRDTHGTLRANLIQPVAETNGFIADGDVPFGNQALDVTVTQVESMVNPNGILNDFTRESVTLVQF